MQRFTKELGEKWKKNSGKCVRQKYFLKSLYCIRVTKKVKKNQNLTRQLKNQSKSSQNLKRYNCFIEKWVSHFWKFPIFWWVDNLRMAKPPIPIKSVLQADFSRSCSFVTSLLFRLKPVLAKKWFKTWKHFIFRLKLWIFEASNKLLPSSGGRNLSRLHHSSLSPIRERRCDAPHVTFTTKFHR